MFGVYHRIIFLKSSGKAWVRGYKLTAIFERNILKNEQPKEVMPYEKAYCFLNDATPASSSWDPTK